MSNSRYPRSLRYLVLFGAGWPCYALQPVARHVRRPWWVAALTVPRRRRPGLFPVPATAIVHKDPAADWPETIKMWPSLVAWGRWDRVAVTRQSWEHPHIAAVLDGADYRELPVYHALHRELAERGRTYLKNLRSPADIDAYFRGIPRLAQSIREHGIQPGRVHQSKEIQVRVTRDGRLLKCGEGTHRLAIARAVGIDTVPVEVELCHAAWARYVVERYRRPFPEALATWFRDSVAGPAGQHHAP